MPTLSMFYGVIIRMYVEEGGRHSTPHIHAQYQENKAVFGFDGTVIEGWIPNKQRKLVEAWIELHRDELEANWITLNDDGTFFKIDPLR